MSTFTLRAAKYSSSVQNMITRIAPGLMIAIKIAAASLEFGNAFVLPPLVLALIIGMAFSQIISHEETAPGVALAIRPILRVGVGLLGAQVTFDQLGMLGIRAAITTIVGLTVALLVGLVVGRYQRLSRGTALVASGAVAICGASASLALAAIVPKHERKEEEVAATVTGVTIIGTAAMIIYPIIARILNLDGIATGIFLGASLHEVAQAVGAGMSVSENVGNVATAVKLLRVACLTPVIIIAAILIRRGNGEEYTQSKIPVIPGFLIGFFLLMILSSSGLLLPVVQRVLIETSRLCLLVAIAAVGMKTSFGAVLNLSYS